MRPPVRPGAKGKGPSYNDARCANTRTRSARVLSVDACQRCGEDLTDAACTGHERRTLIDIVFEKVVRHADAQIKHCPRCHAETRARFPHQMPGLLFVTLFRSGFLGLFLIGRGSISHIVPPLSESRCGADWGRRPPW